MLCPVSETVFYDSCICRKDCKPGELRNFLIKEITIIRTSLAKSIDFSPSSLEGRNCQSSDITLNDRIGDIPFDGHGLLHPFRNTIGLYRAYDITYHSSELPASVVRNSEAKSNGSQVGDHFIKNFSVDVGDSRAVVRHHCTGK